MNESLRTLCVSFTVLVFAHFTAAEEKTSHPTSPAKIYKSPHFVLHTDLPAAKAAANLTRMEAVLRAASQYWRRPPRGRIHCYLVGSLKNWVDADLPHPLARVWVGRLGGATIGKVINGERRIKNKATVYSANRPGIIEHEVIHAYCAQTFNEMGPDWYKEGMAEVVSLRVTGQRDVVCTTERIELLRSDAPRSVQQVIAGERFTNKMAESLDAMLKNRKNARRHVPVTDWKEGDADELRVAEESYAWSWALCHLLVNNPNYADRFRVLGASYLQKRFDSFGGAFSAVSSELDFELDFFARRVDVGYRVDLCSWDWHKRFRTLDEGPEVNIRVAAARGFQASGLQVFDGRRYNYVATGSWMTSVKGPKTDADGTPSGAGKLIGVVMNDFRLSQPFELGSAGAFVAPATGKLYLRCQDDWNKLADNGGDVRVQFTH